jgi:hypothetical protein
MRFIGAIPQACACGYMLTPRSRLGVWRFLTLAALRQSQM